ncbi:pseudouridine synthase [Roseateles caseinilyticus]|uniref:pseudouridine synthase n=1 Tax=Pelomonas caseinilytica TaxID=2906763 RepID=UPI0032C221E7
MATLTLKNKKPAAKTRTAEGEKRAPVRGKGVSKPRPTLAQAQAERAEREEQFLQSQQRRERPAPLREEHPARPKAGAFKPERPPAGHPPRGDAPPRGPRARPDERPAPGRPPRVDQRRVANRGPGLEPPQRPQQRLNPARQVDAEDGDRLSKRMSELKMASRREADEWIAAGWVRVNGKVAVLGQRVVGDVQIDIDPAARQAQAQLVTVLLHKPIGYVSGQAEDGYEPAVVLFQPENRWKDDPSGIKPHPNHHRHLAPAGRLDIDSTGLLVLTQDGRIAKALIGDDSLIEKEYLVRVEFVGHAVPEGTLPNAALAPEKLALLNHGLELDGEPLKPAKVSWQNEQQLRFVLREGKKRQIRRMCELVGLKVVGLKRVRIGRIPLGHLPVGQWRYLAPWERF